MWGIPQDEGEKENVALYKKFTAVKKGHMSHLGEKQTRGDNTALLQCWMCGKDHHKTKVGMYLERQ